MKTESLLLLCAAIFAGSSSAAAVRYENRHAPRHYPSLNGTGTLTTTSSSSTTTSSLSDTSGTDDGLPGATAPGYSPGSTTTKATISTSTTGPTTDLPPTTHLVTATTHRNSLPLNDTITIITRSDNDHGAPNMTMTVTGTFWGSHDPPSTVPVTTKPCTPLRDGEAVIEFSIVYTATTTFLGNRTDYTPPFATIDVPTYCSSSDTLGLPMPTEEPQTSSKKTGGLQVSTIITTDGDRTYTIPGSPYLTSDSPPPAAPPPPASSRSTTTFVTTDKNPSSTFPNDPIPGYSQTWDNVNGGGGGGGVHKTAANNGGGGGPKQPQPTYTVTAGPDTVVINDSTFTNLQPGKTQTVVVGDGTFTISPTAVVGEGSSIQKPQPGGDNGGAASPTTKLLDGVSVVVSGTNAVVGGTTVAIPTDGVATIIDGKSVSVGPGALIVGDKTLTLVNAPARTDVVVAGGEMLTAIGPSVVVIHSTTLTYGPGIAGTTEVVDDDTISIGPSGVVVHGSTLGGPDASTTDTTYEIVGGATITELGQSLVVIDGKTYTVGPDADKTTMVVGGQTITIGPDGVTVATMTMTYPFGSVVTTILPSGTWGNDMPVETGGQVNVNGGSPDDGDGDEDAGALLRPSLGWGTTGLCIAIGVWVL